MRLILASASPRRKYLLRRHKIPFSVIPSRVCESCRERDPRRLVVALALRKALDVARRHPEAVVLGADTIVTCRGQVLLKPRSVRDSERILRTLNGRWQRVYTGVALVARGGRVRLTRAVMSSVLARRLPEGRLQALVGKHMDKAGSYAVQDRKDPFIARVSGDFDNVVGLPVAAVRGMLKRLESRLSGPALGPAAKKRR